MACGFTTSYARYTSILSLNPLWMSQGAGLVFSPVHSGALQAGRRGYVEGGVSMGVSMVERMRTISVLCVGEMC